MRGHIIAWCLAGLLAVASAEAFAQAGFDRPGGDYTNFPVRSGDPAACAARCEREARCRAWSFAYPAQRGPSAVCWLKAQVTPRLENNCCISGVKGAGVLEPRSGPMEFAIDRTGGDYRSFETADDPSGKACATACEGEARCRAWTYVRPGYLGAPRCYLKDRLTPPRRKPCCVSGVVR
jgi:PAN domain-containing protein